MKLKPVQIKVNHYEIYRVIHKNKLELVCKVEFKDKYISDLEEFEDKTLKEYKHELKNGIRLEIWTSTTTKKIEHDNRKNEIYKYFLENSCFDCGLDDIAKHFGVSVTTVTRIISEYLKSN